MKKLCGLICLVLMWVVSVTITYADKGRPQGENKYNITLRYKYY